MGRTFGVHVQTVGLAAVAGRHVVVTDGDVEGVAAGDVVTQRLPVHGDQTGPGLCDLQPLGGSHGFYRKRNTEGKVNHHDEEGNISPLCDESTGKETSINFRRFVINVHATCKCTWSCQKKAQES